MKKVISLLVICIVAILPMTAQVGYESQIKASYNIGVGTYKNRAILAEFVGGYNFNNIIRLGVGVGLGSTDMQYTPAKEGYEDFSAYRESSLFLPVFANFKATLPTDKRIRPYFTTDLGYSIFLPGSDFAHCDKMGFFVKPAIGIQLPMPKGKILFELGYKYQDRSCKHKSNGKTIEIGSYSQVSIGIGYIF